MGPWSPSKRVEPIQGRTTIVTPTVACSSRHLCPAALPVVKSPPLQPASCQLVPLLSNAPDRTFPLHSLASRMPATMLPPRLPTPPPPRSDAREARGKLTGEETSGRRRCRWNGCRGGEEAPWGGEMNLRVRV